MNETVNPWDALERAVEQGRRYARRADHFEERAVAAEARIEAVQDVHWADKALSGHVCAEDGHDWPCPTIRALEA